MEWVNHVIDMTPGRKKQNFASNGEQTHVHEFVGSTKSAESEDERGKKEHRLVMRVYYKKSILHTCNIDFLVLSTIYKLQMNLHSTVIHIL